MFKELLKSLDENLEVKEGRDEWTSSGDWYEVEIKGGEDTIQLRKLIVSKLILKDVPLGNLEVGHDFEVDIHVKLGKEAKLYEAFEEVVGEIKSEGKTIDEIFERVNDLSPEECKILFKKIMTILF